MPFVLDYNDYGDVTGGHFVEQLPSTPTRLQTHSQQQTPEPKMLPNSQPIAPHGWQPPSRRYPPPQQDPSQDSNLHVVAPQAVRNAPPTEPAAFRRQNQHQFHRVGGFNHGVRPYQQWHSHQQRGPPRSVTSYHQQWRPSPNQFSHQGQLERRNTQPLPSRPPPPQAEYYAPQDLGYNVPSFGFHPQMSTAAFEVQLQGDQPSFTLPIHMQMQTPVFFNEAITPNLLLQPIGPPLDARAQDFVPQPGTPLKEALSHETLQTDLEKPKQFVNEFAAKFCGDTTALATFEALCKNYNKRGITETELYVGIYRVLLRGGSLGLLPSFLGFLPPAWKDTDLSWLNRAVEAEYQEKLQQAKQSGSQQEKTPAKASEEVQAEAPEQAYEEDLAEAAVEAPIRKKKRPMNGFVTSSRKGSASGKQRTARPAAVLTGPPSALPSPLPSPKTTAPPGPTGKKTRTTRSGLVKLPVNVPKNSGASAAASAKSESKAMKRNVSPAHEPSFKKPRFKYGTTPGSAIDHVGPIYPTRRSVLGRASRPYIHANCNARYSHPDDVKAHHKQCSKNSEGKVTAWDEHPSCKVGIAQLLCTRCKDGYVILDQESHDKVQKAIAAGLKYAEDHGIE